MVSSPPVLFLVFNRPDTTRRVMEAIRAARPPRLYVAADGPRNRPGEADLCAEARRIATDVDWPCEVRTVLRDANLGCGAGVGSAITWFFDHEPEGIILEDDCLPSADLFPFFAELLDRFRDDERIMAICGSCYATPESGIDASYYFSYYADMWGWASWRRAWRLYDCDLARWPRFRQAGGLRAATGGIPWRERYWAERFEATASGRLVTWDYPWIYTVMEQAALACYPSRNLVSNLGFRADATHTIVRQGQRADPGLAERPHEVLQFPLHHPDYPVRSATLDAEIDAVRLYLTQPLPRPHGLRAAMRAAVRYVYRMLPASWRSRIDHRRHGVSR